MKFETTPRMCTYLLFFGVGDWEYIEKKTDEFVHRVVTTPGKTQYGEYALDFGLKCIEYGEKYTGVKYPMAKMDQIAVPDFAFGAMENYGAITYRENLLLVYPGITSSAGLERIAEVIAHETAHQWFGNLVSPEDWKYIWLNESFATLFGYEIADFYHPEWQIWEGFLAGETNGAFERDSLIETFPIELPGGDYVVKINPATAPIIYNKGASILQMVRGYLGIEKFKKGIHLFLTKHQFDTANSDDYWSAFEEATGDPISKIMKSWVHQPGYPVVEVKREGDKIKVNQRRFTFLPHDNDQVWMIPLTIACYSENEEPKVLHEIMEERSLEISIPQGTKVVKLNHEQAGFYRVKYEKKELEKLGELVSKKKLPLKDRFGLVSDMYSFLRSGDYSIDDYLGFLKYYENEDEYLPLTEINGSLVHAHDVIESRREEIRSIGRTIFGKVLKKIGYEPVEGEPHKIANLRGSLLWSAFYFGDEDVKNFALAKFEDKKEGKEVHPDILRIIMRIAAAVNADSYSWFIDKIESPDAAETEKINSLVAIASITDKEVLRKVLNYTLEKVPYKNKIYPIMVIGRNLAIVDEIWSWYQENLSTLEKMHPMHYEQVIIGVVSLGGLGREDEVRDFFTTYMEEKPQTADTIKMTLERLEINSRLRNS
ncbi:MAG: M1 family aminopeptidase [Candidatus Hodarchaeales archaeon]